MPSPHHPTLTRLAAQLDELQRLSCLGEAELFASSRVSAWTPGEHVDHLVKVTSSIVRRLLDLDVRPLPGRISLLGRLILSLGRIPRGRGKSPERLRGARVGAAELLQALERLRADVARLEEAHLSPNRGAVVPHPKFGGLTPDQAIRFAVVHNHHHFRIIRDVLGRR